MTDDFLPKFPPLPGLAGAHEQCSLIDSWLATIERRLAELVRTDQDRAEYGRGREKLLDLRHSLFRPFGTSTV
jgi:hypothetical protein